MTKALAEYCQDAKAHLPKCGTDEGLAKAMKLPLWFVKGHLIPELRRRGVIS